MKQKQGTEFGLTNAKEIDNSNSRLISKEEIEDTGLAIITLNEDTEEEISFITLGKYRLTEPTKDKESLKGEIENKEWRLLINIISAVVEETINLKNEQ